MQYRSHDDSPLTTISVKPGAVVIEMLFDKPGCHTRLHSHTFDHWMECVKGSALIEIDEVASVVKAGDRYLVKAHKRHSVQPLALDTELRCVHEHSDIQPGSNDAIPREWLHRLTDAPAEINEPPEFVTMEWPEHAA